MAISLADKTNNNQFASIESTLTDALEDIKSGKRTASKMLILMLDDESGYDVGFYASKLKCSEMQALMTRFSYIINRDFQS